MASTVYYTANPAPTVDGSTILVDPSTGKLKSGIENATESTPGLMSSEDKTKLDNIDSGANAYTLPEASSTTLGGVKVGANLSISNGVLNATDTIYSDATTSQHGLMSASDKTKLNGIAKNANNYSLPEATSTTLGGVKIDNDTITKNSNGQIVVSAINSVSWEQSVTEGKKIGAITINNNKTDIYVPQYEFNTAYDVTSNKVATMSDIASAINGVTQFDYEIVESLPSIGTKGKIYLVSNGDTTGDNIYNEYIYIGSKFELVGSTKIDISGKADKATTLSGYGITDAKIESGVITLGNNTITPLTASSTLNATKVSGTLPTSTYTDTKDASSLTCTSATYGGSSDTTSIQTALNNLSTAVESKTSNVGTVTSVTVMGSDGLSGSGTVTTSGTVTLSNSGVRSITQNSSDGHKLTINTGGTTSEITIPDSFNAILPSTPTDDGQYIIQLNMSSNVPTYSWEKVTNLEEVGF